MAYQYNQLQNEENNKKNQQQIHIQQQGIMNPTQQQPQPIYYQSQPAIYHTPQPIATSYQIHDTHSFNDKHSSDHAYSLALLIMGIFTFFPLLANVIYLKSPHCSARKHALASVILASCYLIVPTIILPIVYANYINNAYYYNYYNNNNNRQY